MCWVLNEGQTQGLMEVKRTPKSKQAFLELKRWLTPVLGLPIQPKFHRCVCNWVMTQFTGVFLQPAGHLRKELGQGAKRWMTWMLLLLDSEPWVAKVYAWAPSHGPHAPWHRGCTKFKGKSVVDWQQVTQVSGISPKTWIQLSVRGREGRLSTPLETSSWKATHPILISQVSPQKTLIWSFIQMGVSIKEDIHYAGYARVTNFHVFASGPIPENSSA